MNRHLLTLFAALATLPVVASESAPALTSEFDFSAPATLQPPVAEPATKEWFPLDGFTFTSGDAAVSFKASSEGNTHVRLFGSYDAGCDLRIYDGETMTVRSLNPDLCISKINFEMSLSGTTSDIDLIPSCGTYEWLENAWHADGEPVSEVELTSNKQSRMRKMTVTFAVSTSVDAITDSNASLPSRFYDLQGRQLDGCPDAAGIYIEVTPSGSRKIAIR